MRGGVTDFARTLEPRATATYVSVIGSILQRVGMHTMPAQQNCCRCDSLLLRDFNDGLCRKERASSASQRAVSSDVDALLLAEVDDLLLWQSRMVLNLVDCRHYGNLG